MEGDILVVTEGPLCSRSLQLQGVNATSMLGCKPSVTQWKTISRFPGKIIIGFDNDWPGQQGLIHCEELRKELCKPPIYSCQPPEGCKDWNDAHIKKIALRDYIEENHKAVSWDNDIIDSLSSL